MNTQTIKHPEDQTNAILIDGAAELLAVQLSTPKKTYDSAPHAIAAYLNNADESIIKHYNSLSKIQKIMILDEVDYVARVLADRKPPAPANAKAIQSIQTRSGSTELAIETFLNELKQLQNDAPRVHNAIEGLTDALEAIEIARADLYAYLNDTAMEGLHE